MSNNYVTYSGLVSYIEKYFKRATFKEINDGVANDNIVTNAALAGSSIKSGSGTTSTGSSLVRVISAVSSATPSINVDITDIYKLTAQAVDITSFTTNLTGTPLDGNVLEIQITGTAARAITWGASFASSTVALPVTTVTTTTLTITLQYFTTSSFGNNKWICVNVF